MPLQTVRKTKRDNGGARLWHVAAATWTMGELRCGYLQTPLYRGEKDIMTAPHDAEKDTGTHEPEDGSADRPAGTVDEDANPPISDPTTSDVHGGTGETPPKDTGSAIPPYEGRTESG
jgi:hypothetical protein